MSPSDRVWTYAHTVFEDPRVTAAVSALGGHCIVDFAWLGPGKVLTRPPLSSSCMYYVIIKQPNYFTFRFWSSS